MVTWARVRLEFGERGEAVLDDLSAGARIGSTLIVAGDETAALEVLVRDGASWRFAATVPVADLVELPGGRDAECDVEALAIDDGWLWVVGSHALVRPDPGAGPEGLRRLEDVRRDANRYLLARIPLRDLGEGRFEPVAADGDRAAGMLTAGKRSSRLMKWIGEDGLLAPFTRLPSKENGFDVEGLAVGGGSVFLGLRGPVIRGHAVILELALSGARRGGLKARKLEGGQRFRRHLVWLDGLGVRDLAIDGRDLLILGGGTTMADGPSSIWRWNGALDAGASALVDRAAVNQVAMLEWRPGRDNAEALVPWDDGQMLLLHDRPAAVRRGRRTGSYAADLVTLG